MNQQELGAELRRLRLAANMTLDALAAASGVSVRGIIDLELGRRMPRRATLAAIAGGLGVEGAARAALIQVAGGPAAPRASGAPSRPEHFVGREAELRRIGRTLADASADAPHPVVISGASGIGKTALALEGAHALGRLPVFVDATGFDASAHSVRTILGQLVARGDRAPSRVDTVREWRARTATPAHVSILDGVGSEELARALLAAQSGGVALITSRRPLQGVEGAARIRVGPLDDASSRALLRTRVGASDADDIAELARVADGFPGALVVVADLIRREGSTAAARALLRPERGRLHALTSDTRSMLVALQNSDNLLGVRAAALLRMAAGQPGEAVDPVQLTARVGGSVHDVTDLLDDLVDHGLLEADDRGYRMLTLVRLFATGLI
ncbi:helix-turn-helix domain-containing protein [Microbacterium sp. NPDC091313]